MKLTFGGLRGCEAVDAPPRSDVEPEGVGSALSRLRLTNPSVIFSAMFRLVMTGLEGRFA